MKQQFQDQRDGRERQNPDKQPTAKKPGSGGLANEARPGLGARADESDPAANAADISTKGKPRATTHGYEEPRPAPRDQPPDSLAHEQERQTGMSGQSSGT